MVPAQNRLKGAKEIKLLFEKGRGAFGILCGIKYRKNNLKISRFAFVVGLKVSKSAVKRNTAKRRLREAVRKHIKETKPGLDVAIIAKQAIIEAKFDQIEKDVVGLFKKIGLL
ncbi:MAG: hypothetical protein ACD_76C00004G0001 [uncultured bacterium]|nr:MAG: hypothetical protein ACD_76C00004G0001 [uncultured bacterium]HBD05753.1 ribonuclease P protein component [Candidatus Uhrbacteria bacterium]